MTITWTWDLQAYISGSWTSINRDVEIHRTPVVAKRGISGAGVTNRVASPGTLTCSLDNGESNSAGLLGYYSPNHANMRANFGRDTRVRLKIMYGGTDYYVWHGYITDLDPTMGKYRERSTRLAAADYMQRLAKQKLQLLPVQRDKCSDQIISTILTSMPVQPLNSSLSADKIYLPFALSAETDEKTVMMGVIQKVCQTVLGYFFIRGNMTDGETAVFQREENRAVMTSAATLDDTMCELIVRRSTDDMYNRVIGKIHPTRVDETADTLLYENDSDIYVDAGDTQVFTFRFKDPNSQAVRISALDVTETPEAGTHYRASRYQNTNYNDANDLISVTAQNGGNSSDWTIQNTGGYRVYINKINIFGRGIYYYNPVTLIAESGSGDRELSYDFYYLDDAQRARSFLNRILTRVSADTPDVEAISFYADENATLMGYAMTLDIGSRITVRESVTGVDGEYHINNVTYTIESTGALKITWGLEPADTKSYFILGSSLLGGTDVLAPY